MATHQYTLLASPEKWQVSMSHLEQHDFAAMYCLVKCRSLSCKLVCNSGAQPLDVCLPLEGSEGLGSTSSASHGVAPVSDLVPSLVLYKVIIGPQHVKLCSATLL